MQHSDLIAAIFRDIVTHGAVREDYLAEQVRRADQTGGDIDTLSARISQIRTWTYVSHRPHWLANPSHWQEKTREIEDRLSDALHERLTKRFVDRRTSVLMKRLRENAMLEAEIGVDGDVFVEGHHVGQLSGFRFTPDSSAEGPDQKAVMSAAQKSLAIEFEARAARLHASGNHDFALGSDGTVRWLGDPVARLASSDSILAPRIILLADDQLSGQARDVVTARIERFVNHHISTILKPLDDLAKAEDLEGLAKGLAFRIVEGLGVLFRRDVADDVKALDQEARGTLRRYGVRFGAYHVFMPALLKPAPAEIITMLWALRNEGFDKPGYGDIAAALAAGRTSIVTEPEYQRDFYRLAGFRYLGKRAVRIDILERLADLIRPLLQWNPGNGVPPEGAYDGRRFTTTPAMLSILGATPDDMEEILKGLGYRSESIEPAVAKAHLEGLRAKATPPPTDEGKADEASTEARIESGSGETPEDGLTEEPASEAESKATVGAAPEDGGQPVEAVATAETQLEMQTATPATADDGAGDEIQAAADTTGEEEPKPVLLWRPAGRNENNRNRQNRPGNRQRQGAGRGKGDDRNQPHRNGKGKPPRHGKKHGDNSKPRPPRKEKPIDPDSPFAKLAALKEQMNK